MTRIIQIFVILFLFASCEETSNKDSSKLNTNSKVKVMENVKKDFSPEMKEETDKLILEINTVAESVKPNSCIISGKGMFGDGKIWYYDESKISKIAYEPGDVTEYYYFDKSGNLIYAETSQFHYQPWSQEINKFYIEGTKILASYKCVKENSGNDPCNEKIFENDSLISNFENNISGRLAATAKSMKKWPEIEKKLIELSKK